MMHAQMHAVKFRTQSGLDCPQLIKISFVCPFTSHKYQVSKFTVLRRSEAVIVAWHSVLMLLCKARVKKTEKRTGSGEQM